MENKKKIDLTISIILVLLVIAIIVTLFLFITQNSNQQVEHTKNEEHIKSASDINIKQENKNDGSNTTKKIKYQGEEIDQKSENAKEILKKLSFSNDYVINSIYKNGDFTIDNIPNDLILKMAWSKIGGPEEKIIEWIGSQRKETVKSDIMKKYINEIFGRTISYKDDSFSMSKNLTKDEQDKYQVSYYVDKKEYISSGNISGNDWDIVKENIDKITKIDNKINIYVKTAFINEVVPPLYEQTVPSELVSPAKYDVYKDFNGEEKVMSYVIDYSSKEVLDKLNTYVYQFEYDKEEEDYYLIGFKKVIN